MNPFIVLIGRAGREIVYARDLDGALLKAQEFAIAGGMSVEEAHDPDEVAAMPFDPWVARDHGLMWLDEAERHWETQEARS